MRSLTSTLDRCDTVQYSVFCEKLTGISLRFKKSLCKILSACQYFFLNEEV